MVIGGGLAGMEAAMMLAKRGHSVSLYEKTDGLGGQWNILASYRPEVSSITNYLSRELAKSGFRCSTTLRSMWSWSETAAGCCGHSHGGKTEAARYPWGSGQECRAGQ
jgi:cation diffusion facilitator CzcD-associated flavoprotein CzcO